MPRPALLATLSAISFLVCLLLGAPADLLGHAASARGWQLISPAGTVWHGRAAALRKQRLSLDKLRWDWQPLALLRARLAARLEAILPGGYLRTRAALASGRQIELSELEAAVPLRVAGAWLGIPLDDGAASLRFDSLLLVDGWPRAAVGELRLAQLPLALPGSGIDAGRGNILLRFAQPEAAAPLAAELSDLGGDLELTGRLELSPPRNYLVAGRLRARPQAPESLRQGLALLGPADPGGRHEFSLSGSLQSR